MYLHYVAFLLALLKIRPAAVFWARCLSSFANWS